VNSVDISTLADDDLWRLFLALAAQERVVIADLVASLAEVERRNLIRDRHWPSVFDYCVYSLRWSESAAYRRIRAARAVRKFPIILEMLRDGRLHLEGIVILHAFIEDPDFAALLLKAVGLTTKAIERLVADRRRDPPVRDVMRFVGVAPPLPAVSNPAPDLDFSLRMGGFGSPPEARIWPLREVRPLHESPRLEKPSSAAPPPSKLVRIGFTADESLHLMVLRAQQLMRHKYPSGSLEGIFRDALKLLIEKKDPGVRVQAAAARLASRKERRQSSGT
jgi:hypothetical protein